MHIPQSIPSGPREAAMARWEIPHSPLLQSWPLGLIRGVCWYVPGNLSLPIEGDAWAEILFFFSPVLPCVVTCDVGTAVANWWPQEQA